MNLMVLHQHMGKMFARISSLTLAWQLVKEKFKSVVDLEKDGLREAITPQDPTQDVKIND